MARGRLRRRLHTRLRGRPGATLRGGGLRCRRSPGRARLWLGRSPIPRELPVAPVDRRNQAPHELADSIGLGVDALEYLALDLDGDDAVARGRLDAQFAELETGPANELPRCPRTVGPGVDSNRRRDQTGPRRNHHQIADARILAPLHPAVRVSGGAEIAENRLEHAQNCIAHAPGIRSRLPPLAKLHRVASTYRSAGAPVANEAITALPWAREPQPQE